MLAMLLVVMMYGFETMLITIYSEKWFAPIVPFLAIFIVVQLHWLWVRIRSNVGSSVALTLLQAFVGTGLLAMIVQPQLKELIRLSQTRQQASTITRAEAWLSQQLRPGDKVLLLQATRADIQGQFPRIQMHGVQMYTARPDGSFQQVCLGEQGDSYRSRLPLSREVCYPRPRLSSSTQRHLPILLEEFDFVVLVNGAKNQLTSAELSWLA